MGVGTVKIDKISENNGIPLYKISTKDYTSQDYFVEVDSLENELRFYYSKSAVNPAYIIKYNDEQIIVPLKKVHERVFFGALSKLLKALIEKKFPEKMSYSG